MSLEESIDYDPQKNRLNFESDPEHILDIFFVFVESPVINLCETVKVKLEKPVTVYFWKT